MCNVGGDEVAHNFYEREARLDPRDSIRPFLNPFSQAFDANPMLSPDSLDGFRFPFYFLRILLELSYTFASKKNEDAPFSAVYRLRNNFIFTSTMSFVWTLPLQSNGMTTGQSP